MQLSKENGEYMRIDEHTDSESGDEITRKNTSIANKTDNPNQGVNETQSWKRKLILVSIFMVYFSVFGVITIITPYFTTVALELGISRTAAGFIFSFYPVFGIIVSFIVPLLFPVFSPRTLLSGCLVLAGLSLMVFGFGTMLPNIKSFYAFSFVFRMLASVGANSCYTAVVSVAAQEFPNDCGFVLGVGEAMSGLGALVAPALGGLIFQSLGYLWPTMVWGLLMMATAAILLVIFKDVEFIKHERQTGLFQHAWKVVRLPGILIAVELIFLGSSFRGALDPVIAIFGKEVLHSRPRTTGLIYSGLWLTYFVTSAPVGKLVDKFEKHFYFFCLGYTIDTIGFLLLGPSPLFDFLPVGTTWLAVVTLVLIGFSDSLVTTPTMPYLVHITRTGGVEMDSLTTGVLSAIFTSVAHLGGFAGPTVVTVLADHVNIRWDFSIVGLVALGQTVLLLLYALWNCTCCPDKEQPEMEEIHPIKKYAAGFNMDLDKPD